MDKVQRKAAAQSLMDNKIATPLFDEAERAMVKKLLAATTPEDREEQFQEIQALKRVRSLLLTWAK